MPLFFIRAYNFFKAFQDQISVESKKDFSSYNGVIILSII